MSVVWWLGRGPGPRAFRELFVEPFNAGPGRVRLELVVLAEAAQERTVAALDAGTGPDIVMIPRAGDFLALAGRGHLLDLSAYADRFAWGSRLLAPALRLATVGGRLFGVPRSSETMMLLFHPEGLGAGPPASLPELEAAAGRVLRQGLIPFGAGCADMPQSCELLWTLVVNHYAGPAAVRAALRGELPWTALVFAEAVGQLCAWFDRGWFGDGYFTDTIAEGLARVVGGTAAMAPAMTGMLPDDHSRLGVAPFPSLREQVPFPLYVFGTASLIGINAATADADDAAHVLDALFDPRVRRQFSAHEPGDWNIPLADPDAAELRRVSPRVLAEPAIGLTEAVAAHRFGYATWSFLPPKAEALVVGQVRPLVEGRLTVRDHLAQLQAAFAEEVAPGLD
jgi:raffinose/stachyose/melibiose transport system substrate-binding protein